MSEQHGQPERGAGPIYLILERDLLIAADLAGALEVHQPSRVISVRTAEEAQRELEQVERLDMAIVDIPIGDFERLGFDARFRERGIQVIFTVGEDDATAVEEKGWGMLVRPFTDDMIRATIETLKSRR